MAAAANQLGSVEHIVVLVLENRSFDHMLGFRYAPLTARDAAAPDVGDVLTLAQPRTDDPLAGVTVPASAVANPVAGTPSHIQQTYAQLVSALPVNDTQGQTHAAIPTLKTEQDYHDYIASRSAAWTAERTRRAQ